ncbi:hypothetical protein L873DRAFT_1814234 [Choiromyces venosus 120613-1]|uniref:Uncharacterized protein n=1 Tax=Choiromyces venosus 120613-1 TaxID=1336337 RepID=A0A3N4J8C1_9PEZI|nr:hypothetical protein L873DRAFT_1814234 [Choiromyces venosus 120613-1]
MSFDPTSQNTSNFGIIPSTLTYILLPTLTAYLSYPYMVLRILSVHLIANKLNRLPSYDPSLPVPVSNMTKPA